MRANRVGSNVEQDGSRPYAPQQPQTDGAPVTVGSGGAMPPLSSRMGPSQGSYGYGSVPPPLSAKSYANHDPSRYPRALPSGPVPPYPPPPDRRFPGERVEDRRDSGGYLPERRYSYDHPYDVPSEQGSYGHAPAVPGPYSSARYEASGGASATQPFFDHQQRRGRPEAERYHIQHSQSYPTGSPASSPPLSSTSRKIPPEMIHNALPRSHAYTEGSPKHYALHPKGPPPPYSVDHPPGRPPYEPSYPPSFVNREYESDRRWGPPKERSSARPQYGAYENNDALPGAAQDRHGPRPSAVPAHGLPPHSPPRAHSTEYSAAPYRYDDGPVPTPQHDARPPLNSDTLQPPLRGHPKPSLTEHRIISDANSAAGSNADAPPQEVTSSTTENYSSQRDDVSNMGCTCKKSKCLKLYCQCFAASVVCGPNCRCLVCQNTPRHETTRKEAIRAILQRNPQAFETKFKSTNKTVTAAQKGRVGILAHKSGCKCRKSACLKKYCECYHAGVKCNINCRCVGCQNMPPGGFGPSRGSEASMSAMSCATDVYSVKNSYNGGYHGERPGYSSEKSNGEPWMMDAAQNLTFLKNASPQAERKIHFSDARDIPPMPSLVSSDASPDIAGGGKRQAQICAPENQIISPDTEKSAGKAVNALLMAAYAMTELTSGGTPPITPPKATERPEDMKDRATPLRASPKRKSDQNELSSPTKSMKYPSELNGGGHQSTFNRRPDPGDSSSYQMGDVSGRHAQFKPEEQRDTQRALSYEASVSQISATGQSHNMTPKLTPSNDRDIKRSRVGSVQKAAQSEARGPLYNHAGAFATSSSCKPPLSGIDGTPRLEKNANIDSDEDNNDDDESTSSNSVSKQHETPRKDKTPKGATIGVLTPVTARCIDFQHMGMNGSDRGRQLEMDMQQEAEGTKDVSHDEKKSEAMELVASS